MTDIPDEVLDDFLDDMARFNGCEWGAIPSGEVRAALAAAIARAEPETANLTTTSDADYWRSEALREAATAARGMHDPPSPDCAEWADWLDARAAAILVKPGGLSNTFNPYTDHDDEEDER